MLNRVYLGLGSNIGDKRANIAKGLELIGQLGKGLITSSLYETAPQSFPNQPPYMNAACGLWTGLDPFELIHELGGIELSMGRVRAFVNAPRTLDIDILLYGKYVLESPILSIPHHRMAEREFVLRPLAEIAAEAAHPVFRRSIKSLLQSLPTSDPAMFRTGFRLEATSLP